jgi:hypothetical protein
MVFLSAAAFLMFEGRRRCLPTLKKEKKEEKGRGWGLIWGVVKSE